jgi:acyl-CoA thioesterase-1
VQGRVLFAGDSVTDCGWRGDSDGLGHGYVRLLAATHELAGCSVRNVGKGGDRLQDLERRWRRDVLDARPDAVSVMIGINDTWRRFDSGEVSGIEEFSDRYRALLSSLPTDTQIVLMEPFLIPVDARQQEWRQDLDPRIHVVRLLGQEFGATVVPVDGALNRRAASVGAAALASDGVHPTAAGHREIASAWLTAVAPS